MIKLGFLLSRLDDQLGFQVIASSRRLIESRQDVDVILFVVNPSLPLQTPPCGVMNIHEAFDFGGTTIATDLDTVLRSLRFPGPSSRIFYSWDLQWMRRPGWSFEELSALYHDPRLVLAARNEDHKDAIERAWNVRVPLIVPDADAAGFVAGGAPWK